MELLIAFLVGVASSTAVAYVVYRRQRREQLQSEESLLRQLGQHADLLGIAASTGLIVQRSTARLERDVSILRRQLVERVDSRETILKGHIDEARNLLSPDGKLDERTVLDVHRVIVGPDFEYAGEFRDVNVSIGGPGSAIRAPEPASVLQELRGVLEKWNTAVRDGKHRSRDQWLDLIVRLHASVIRVHPFFDGNGLFARVLLAVQTRERLGTPILLPRRDANYFTALQKACDGDVEDLLRYVKAKADDAAQEQHAADGASRRS